MILLGLYTLVVYSAWLVGPFLIAGGLAWHVGIAYYCVLIVGTLANQLTVKRKSAEIYKQRQELGKGTPTWDMVWNLVFWPLMALTPHVAALGVRFGWPRLPLTCWPAGLLVYGCGMALSAWAMISNRHFEGTVRIQSERDHRVVDTGPYATIRHPGYLGLILWALASPLLLLSAWAFVPAAVVAGWIVLRTALEDRFLKRGLVGYTDYAARVRSRLVPHIW